MTVREKIFAAAKGMRGRAKNCIKIARNRVEKSWQYQYRDRRNKKRDWRRLWITRINAATREHGVRCLCLCVRARARRVIVCVCVCLVCNRGERAAVLSLVVSSRLCTDVASHDYRLNIMSSLMD